MSEGHKSAKDVRQAKLEAALKENLRRRKAQARGRKAPVDKNGPVRNGAPEAPSSGPPTVKDRN